MPAALAEDVISLIVKNYKVIRNVTHSHAYDSHRCGFMILLSRCAFPDNHVIDNAVFLKLFDNV